MSELSIVSSALVWRRLQSRFALLFMAAALAVLAGLIALHPTGPLVRDLRWGLFCSIGAAFVAHFLRPQWDRACCQLMVLLVAAAVVQTAWIAPAHVFPQFLDLLPFVALAATLFVGPDSGDLLTVGLLVVLAALAAWRGWFLTDHGAFRHLTNIMLMLLLQQLVLGPLWRAMREAVGELDRANHSLRLTSDQTRQMSRVAFQDARTLVRELGSCLRQGVGASQCVPLSEDLSALLAAQRRALPQLPEEPQLEDSFQRLQALRQVLRAKVMLGACLVFGVALFRNLALGVGSPTVAVTLLGGLLFGAAWALRRLPAQGLWAFRVASFTAVALMLWVDWHQTPTDPGMLRINGLVCIFFIFMAALLDGPWLAATMLGLELVVLSLFSATGLDTGGWVTGLDLGLSLLAAWALWRLPAELLLRLASDAKHLAQAVRHRRRMLCTLFHDLANPLQAVAILVETGEEEARTLRLVDRMERVLEVAASLEQAPPRLQPVDLGQVVGELTDLFRERLGAKGLDLSVDCQDGDALAQPELLRESVLGNLLGNAIKFSPVGGRLRITTRRQEAWVELCLQDQGPGFPDAARLALSEGRRVPSTLGSQGEPGHGYGLTLAQDYLAQMGGQLELSSAAQGGTWAIVRLRPAHA